MNKLTVVFSVVIALSFDSMAVCKDSNYCKEVSSYINEAYQLDKKGDARAAIRKLNKAAKLKTANSSLFLNRGAYYLDLKEFGQAIKDFDRALDCDPNCFGAFYNRALAQQLKGQYKSAIVDYTKSIEQGCKIADSYYNRGVAKEEIQQIDSALSDYNKAIKFGCSYYGVYNNRGLIKSERGDIQGALQDYQSAIEKNPNDFQVYFNRAYNHLFDTKNYIAAVKDLETVLKLNPSHKKSIFFLASAKFFSGDKKGAIDDFGKASY